MAKKDGEPEDAQVAAMKRIAVAVEVLALVVGERIATALEKDADKLRARITTLEAENDQIAKEVTRLGFRDKNSIEVRARVKALLTHVDQRIGVAEDERAVAPGISPVLEALRKAIS